MLETKTFEVRDRMTLIPCVAVKLIGGMTNRLLWKAGFTSQTDSVLLMRADGNGYARCDPYAWGDRTMRAAHLFIQDNWTALKDKQVVDLRHRRPRARRHRRPPPPRLRRIPGHNRNLHRRRASRTNHPQALRTTYFQQARHRRESAFAADLLFGTVVSVRAENKGLAPEFP